jgi:hypothetical protein
LWVNKASKVAMEAVLLMCAVLLLLLLLLLLLSSCNAPPDCCLQGFLHRLLHGVCTYRQGPHHAAV